MTVWNKAISWSKFKLALQCPRQLQWTIDKKPVYGEGPNYYQLVGKLVQLTFEHYFNQGVNMRPGGREPAVMEKVVTVVLASKTAMEYHNLLTFPDGKAHEDFYKQVRFQVTNGHRLMLEAGLLNFPVKSEAKWMSVYRGLRLFGQLDFEFREPGKGLWIYDGKGTAKKDADPNQLMWYSLTAASSGEKLAGSGFIYWAHDIEQVDVTPNALKTFADKYLEPVLPLFQRLKTGIAEELPTTPSESSCYFCPWKRTCEASLYRKPEPPDSHIPIMQVSL